MLLAQMVVEYIADTAALDAGAAVATAAFAAIAAGAVVATAVSVKMAGDFQASITRLSTSAGEARSNLQMVSDGILAMAPAVGTSTTQLANGMYMVESAGFHGAAGLEVLRMAAMGAKAENADLGTVANAVTSALNAYGLGADSAAMVTNTLVAATAAGKMHMQDLADAVSNVLPATAKFHISLIDTTAAIATMTMQGDDASSAATHLRQVILALEAPAAAGAKSLAAIGLSSADVSKEMSISLPGAIQMIIDALGKKFPEGSAAYNEALKNIAGGNKQLLGLLEISGTSLQAFKDNVTSITGAVNAGGSSIAGWDLIQGNFNFKMDQAKATIEVLAITIGTALLPYVGKMLDAFQQLVQIGGTVVSFFQHNQVAMTALQAVLIPVAGAIGGLLVYALVAATTATWGAVVAVLALAWPFVAISAAIALLVAGIVLLVQHWNQVSQAFQNNAAFKIVWSILQQLWSILAAQFIPIWQQLVAIWQTQLLPAFQQVWTALQQLWTALQPLAPLLQFIGEIVAGVIIVSFVLLLSVIVGIAKGIAFMLPGIIQAFGGIVQIISGSLQIIIGIITFFVDLFTGKWSKLGADLGTIWQGIVTMFSGAWNVINGLLYAAVGFIVGLISGFISTIIGLFTSLYHDLVGGSVIPDMINGIVSWFGQLPGRVVAIILQLIAQGVANFINFNVQIVNIAISLVNGFIGQISQLISRGAGVFNSFVSMVLGILNGLASSAFNAGASIVNNIAQGIRNAIGAVAGAIGSVTDYIASHLPHSPAKVGALRDLVFQGSQITSQIATGMLAGLPQLETAIGAVTKPVALALGASGTKPSSPSSSNRQTSTAQQGQPVYLILDGRQVGKGVIPYVGPELAKEMRAVLK